MANLGNVSETFARVRLRLTALCELALNIELRRRVATLRSGLFQASCHLRLLRFQTFQCAAKAT